MVDDFETYEEKKRAIYSKKTQQRDNEYLDEMDEKYMKERKVGFADVLQVGSKVLIGGGLGLLAGVAAIAVTASAAEIILAGAVTKVAGVVGGATGLSWGVHKFKKKSKKEIL